MLLTQYHSTRTNTLTYFHTSAKLYITTLLYKTLPSQYTYILVQTIQTQKSPKNHTINHNSSHTILNGKHIMQKCNSHHRTTYLPTPLVTSTLHNTPNPFMPSPKKTPQNKLQKKHLPKSAKTSHVGMHFQQKTLPQKPTKQATMHTRRHAQPTHTSQRDAFTTYLPSLHLSNHTPPMMSM